MTPERYEHLAQVFRATLELEPSQRNSFLDQVCSGDENLRQEVEALLVSHEKSGMLIDTPALEVAAKMLASDKTRLAMGSSISHYQITSLIGVGGMGEVYLATDTKLARKVALKMLPPEFTSDPDRLRRFEQEAKAASALNHPNIITIYETGEVDGVHFIASEFINGQTLRHWMSDARVKLRERITVAIQIANALVEAHAEGIIHRDIKPENVMVRPNGLVKILDFGLAKLTEHRIAIADPGMPPNLIAKTEPGVVMGTYTYMSPEQVRGLEVDARTDIFSLGIVLYEMIAGIVPFPGPTMADVISAILDKNPLPLRQVCPEAPEHLEWIVTKALVKDREERYQTARELITDLKRLERRLDDEAEQERSIKSRDHLKTVKKPTDIIGMPRVLSTLSIKSHKLQVLALAVALGVTLFILAAALLNKRAIVERQPGQATSNGEAQPLISSITPPAPFASIGDQSVSVSGSNFQKDQTVKVIFPNGEWGILSGQQIQNFSPTSFVVIIDFNGNPGLYSFQVISPGGQTSESFAFTAQHIIQKPEIKAILPPSPSVSTGEQDIFVYGLNFQVGLKVDVTLPDRRSVTLSDRQIPNRTPTSFRMLAYFATPGEYKVQAVNPNGQRSNLFTFKVRPAS